MYSEKWDVFKLDFTTFPNIQKYFNIGNKILCNYKIPGRNTEKVFVKNV